jgi:hypothetical protein
VGRPRRAIEERVLRRIRVNTNEVGGVLWFFWPLTGVLESGKSAAPCRSRSRSLQGSWRLKTLMSLPQRLSSGPPALRGPSFFDRLGAGLLSFAHFGTNSPVSLLRSDYTPRRRVRAAQGTRLPPVPPLGSIIADPSCHLTPNTSNLKPRKHKITVSPAASPPS